MNGNEETNSSIAEQILAAKFEIDQSESIAIDKHGYSSQLEDRECGGESTPGCRQHLIARLASEGAQRQLDSIQPARDTNCARRPTESRQRPFELKHLVAQNVPSASSHGLGSRKGVRTGFLPLTLKIVQRDHWREAMSSVKSE